MNTFRLNSNFSLALKERGSQYTCAMSGHENQKLRTTFEMEIYMTDFRVYPPTALIGVLDTEEMVTVMVDLALVFFKEDKLKKSS